MLYSNPIGLYSFQAGLSAYCILRHGNLAVVDAGLGKGLQRGTTVLRPSGEWTCIEDLVVGDWVVGSTGHPVRVDGVYPRDGIPGYRVSMDDGVSVVVDEDHLWAVHTDNDAARNKSWRVMETKDLASSPLCNARGPKWRIPVTPFHGGVWRETVIHPYVMGVLLGDGHVAMGQVSFTSVDPEIVDRVEYLLPPECVLRRDVMTEGKAPRFRIVGRSSGHNPVLDEVRRLGVHGCRSWEKFIPNEYKALPLPSRTELLRGLMDTDGWVGSAIQYTSTSLALADDVAELVRSLGGVSRISSKPSGYRDTDGSYIECRVAYNVSIRTPDSPFFLARKSSIWESKNRLESTRKISSIEPVGEIDSVCIKVDAEDGLFVTEGYIVTHNTHIAQATTGFLLGDGQIDHAIYVVEKNKIEEWEEDFAEFTEMSVNVFHGPKRTLDVESMVTLTTYHTFRDALMVDGELSPIAERFSGRNIMVVFDEAAILGSSRSSDVFKAYERAINLWRKSGANVWVLGLTATPMTTSPESYYNLARIIAPELAMTVKDFGDWYVSVWSKWHKPWKFKNLEHLEQRLAPMMLRKRKTDPDVVDQFPKLVEKFVSISLTPSHLKTYKNLQGWIKGLPEEDQLPGFNALNAFAIHPRAILSPDSQWLRREEWIEQVGVEVIEKLKSAKVDAVIGWIKEILSQDDGSGVLVFCRYVEALKCLAEDIGTDFPFVEFHGGRSDSENRDAKAAFREGRAQVMLASSKAERGINLPQAHYIINLDVPLTHASYIQRYNRGSRIGSNVDGTLMVKTFIGKGTIELSTMRIWMNRNEWSDRMQDTDVDPESEFVSAEMRRAMIKLAQKEGTND